MRRSELIRSPEPDAVDSQRREAGRDNWRVSVRPNIVGA